MTEHERDAVRSAAGVRREVVLALIGLAVLLALAVLFRHGRLTGAEAVLLGAVEGITEFLPISSTGHLAVAERLLDLRGDAADAYAIAIQAGAIVAVLVLYRHRVAALVQGALGRDPAGAKVLRALLVAFVPTAALGVALEPLIKDRLFGMWPIAVAWAVGGVVLLVAARRGIGGRAPLESLGTRTALAIGVVQALALWPGVSRSLVTILAACFLGLSISAAVEFSFLLGVLTLGAATAFEMVSSGDTIRAEFGVAAPLLGFATAALTAAIAIRWMIAYLERRSLSIFGWYRLAASAAVLSLLAIGVL